MLDLSPEIETTVRNYAAREGVSVEELITRAFPPSQVQQGPETPTETDRRVQGLLTKWRAQTGMPANCGSSKSLAELSAEWAAEDAHLTEEELQAEREFWADYEQSQRQYVQI